jgi:LuxR family maltose regulon positive regulatory protein
MLGVDEALRSQLRQELAAIGFVPAASKLYRPEPGIVGRRSLVERIAAARPDLLVVTAPAGYGKSTLVAELAAGDPRPTAWLSLTRAENDAAALLSYVALALDEIEPVDSECVAALWARSVAAGPPGLARFGAMLAERRRPFVLVLDDLHELVERNVLDVLPVLIAELPAGSTLVLVSRTAIAVPLGRLRTRRRIVEVGADELAFDDTDAAVLFSRLDVDVAPDVARQLVEETEGWPVAVYLAVLAHGSGRTPDVGASGAVGHRHLAEFLAEELLGALDPDVSAFLLDASCFERISGTFCDEVLERRGSAALLDDLHRQNLLVIALDDRHEWYRFHHLMSEFLQAELARQHAPRRTANHRRASEWFDAHGDPDAAITHAILAGDLDAAEAMVLRWYGTVATSGRGYPRTERWVAMFPAETLDDRPGLMVVSAWACFAAGDPGRALQWLERATAAFPDLHPDAIRGFVGPVPLALARAILVPMSPAQMAGESTYVYDHVGLGEGHPMACLGRGAAAFAAGDEATALGVLREGADTTLVRPIAVANCLAHAAMIHAGHGRWDDAATAVGQARGLVTELAEFTSSVLILATIVLVETHAGRADEVEAVRLRCRQHLTGLIGIAPWLNVQARAALAKAAVIRGNPAEATALLDEADVIQTTMPGAVGLAGQLAAIRRELSTRHRMQGFGPSSLTTAELRVLQLLPTHLSIAEIADRLYVSRNTVKSQTIAIYRKLATSSRGGAVDAALAAGLLDDVGPKG